MAFAIFAVTDKLVTDTATLDRVTREVVEDYAKHNCRYLEIRSTPKIVGSIADRESYVDTVLDALVTAEDENKGITCGYLVSISRSATVDVARETIDLVIKLRK